MRKSVAFLLALVLMIPLFALPAVAAPPQKVDVLIGFNGRPDAALVRSHGGEVKHVFTLVPVVSARLPEQALAGLAHNPNIAYIEPDGVVQALGVVESITPADAKAAAYTDTVPWGVSKIGANQVWTTTTGSGVKVAILDTGIDLTHPDLHVHGGYNFVSPGASYDDDNGHGSHCAGIVAALGNNSGIIGVAPGADLYAVKVLNASGSGSYTGIVQGIEWAVNNGMDVISMSLGGSQGSTTLESACNSAYNSGVLIVASAGNSGKKRIASDTVGYPAKYESCFAVAATDSKDVRASFSSTGPAVDVAAPGVSIYSCYKDGNYATMSGTSMACPHVTGLAALLLQKNPNWTNANLRAAMTNTALDLGTTGFDWGYGYGRIQAVSAVNYQLP
jgi:subtilisin family serine protease